MKTMTIEDIKKQFTDVGAKMAGKGFRISQIGIEVTHHENGDSEFVIPVTMRVGASDKGSSTVIISGEYPLDIHFSIYQDDVDSFRVYDDIKHVSDRMKSKEDCINWIIEKLRK
jgi:hypothetical protein